MLQFKNMRALRQLIDSLPGRGPWLRTLLKLPRNEGEFVLHHRDTYECAKALVRDPAFAAVMQYTPVMEFPDGEEPCECKARLEQELYDADEFEDERWGYEFYCDGSCGRDRSFNEMSTGRWWWETQVSHHSMS